MRISALLYLAIAASVALAVPAPLPVPQDLGDIVDSLPQDDPNAQLGPDPGTGKHPLPVSGLSIAPSTDYD